MRTINIRGEVSALRACHVLWIWLYETGSSCKAAFPHWNKVIGNFGSKGDVYSGCPCCDYVFHHPKGGCVCSACPLRDLWDGNCMLAWAACKNWRHAWDAKERSRCALEIVRGCEYALAKLGAKVERYVVAASNDAKKEDG